MTVTISYTAFLLTLVAGVGIATLIYFIIVLVRINRTVARLDTTINRADDLLVSLKTLSEEATGTVVAARHLLDEGPRVAAAIAALSAHVRGIAGQGGEHPSLFGRIRSAIAVFAGIKTAYSTLKHFLHNRRQAAAGDADN
ncbi:MAG: hypothetical protein FIB02_06800 [Desulfuromonas sp.]|nr:hypothetical protein [Desulfuromonas sp.]